MEEVSLLCLAAGMSKRFGGELKQFAKIGPNDETLIEWIIDQTLSSNFNKIIFVVREETKEKFQEIFKDNYKGVPVFYTFQKFDREKRQKPWGTGDAVCSAISLIKEPFVVCSGDDLSGQKSFEILSSHLRKINEEATVAKELLQMLPEKGEVNRGVFKTDREYVIDGEEVFGVSRENFKEKSLKEDDLISISIFGLHPKTLHLLNEMLKEFKEKNKENPNVEFYLNTELVNLIKENKIKMKVYKTNEPWYGITNPGDEIKIRNIIKNKK
jgi:NDP-sugar pyrophosphorylase family protein